MGPPPCPCWPSESPPINAGQGLAQFGALSFVAHDPATCGLGLYGLDGGDWVAYGGYTYLHHSVPMYWPKDEPELNAFAEAFDTLVYTRKPPGEAGFNLQHCFGAVCVATLALALALSGSAEGHDRDCHGMPISEAEKLGCCGGGDAHFGEPWQFYNDKDGFWHYLVAGEDLQREFHLDRSQPRHLAPLPKAPTISPRAGLEGVVGPLLFAQRAIEMFRSLPYGPPRHRLDHLANRLTKILSETRKLNPPK